MRTFQAVAAAGVLGLATAACEISTAADGDFSFGVSRGKATTTWSRTYEVAPNARFELINVNGKITAEESSGADIIVEGRMTAKAGSDESAKDLLAKLEIHEDVQRTAIKVESRPPALHGLSGHEIEWIVRVPQGVVVALRTRNGGVRLNGLSNEIHAETRNGGVRGEKLDSSSITVATRNGGIELELARALEATDVVDAETVNGGVALTMPAGSKATIDSRCVNGGVHVDGLDINRDETTSARDRHRRLTGTLNGGGARVRLGTRNGGVHLSGS